MSPPTFRWVAVGAVVVVAAGAVAAMVAGGREDGGRGEPPSGPNVVVVMTDDQDVRSMSVMDKTARLIGERGISFVNSFVTTPLCCPSRATHLTGQLAHNHGVLTNSQPRGGYYELDNSETLPVWLHEAGYQTAHVGKYLNGYGSRDPRAVPRGWDEWHAATGDGSSQLYDYTLNENGAFVEYGDDPADYKTDVLADRAVEVIEERVPRRRPLFMTVWTTAPHTEASRPAGASNPRPAPRDRGAFAQRELPRPPSFDEADVTDKPAVIQSLPRLDARTTAAIAEGHRARLASLLAVDDLVARVARALREAGELDDTLLVFTSDNGYLHGEHRIPVDKRFVYEESVRVPLLLRGPGVPRGESRIQPVANIDLVPTILAAAGARAGLELDGRSLLPLFDDPRAGRRRAVLLEYFGDKAVLEYPGPTGLTFKPKPYAAVHTGRHVYVRHPDGAEELYDLRRDPFQLESRHADPSYAPVRRRLAARLDELEDCAGSECR